MWIFLVVALASASVVAMDGFSMVCNDDNTLTVNIPYDVDVEVLSLTYGTCDKNSSGVTIVKSGTNFTVDLSVSRCGMNSYIRSGLEYRQNATIILGREDSGMDLKMAEFNVNASCSYRSDYTVTYGYNATSDSYKFDSTGGSVNFTFGVDAYNSNYSSVVSLNPSKANRYIYLGLKVIGGVFNYCAKNFVVRECSVKVQGTGQTYRLFSAADGCDNEFINLSVNYDHEQHMWTIQHLMFLLGTYSQASYDMSCEISVCDNLRDDGCLDVIRACTGSEDDVAKMTSCAVEGPIGQEALAAKLQEFKESAPEGVTYVDSWQGDSTIEDVTVLAGSNAPQAPPQGDDVYEPFNSTRKRRQADTSGTTILDQPPAVPSEFSLARDAQCGDFVSVARSQGICATCWAFAAAGVIQDSACRNSGGKFKHFVSTQQLNTCCGACTKNLGLCSSGGSPRAALRFFQGNTINTGGDYLMGAISAGSVHDIMLAYNSSGGGCVPYRYGGLDVNHFGEQFETDTLSCDTTCWSGYDRMNITEDRIGESDGSVTQNSGCDQNENLGWGMRSSSTGNRTSESDGSVTQSSGCGCGHNRTNENLGWGMRSSFSGNRTGESDGTVNQTSGCGENETLGYAMRSSIRATEDMNIIVDEYIGINFGYKQYTQACEDCEWVETVVPTTYNFQEIYDWIRNYGSVVLNYQLFEDFFLIDGVGVYRRNPKAAFVGWHAVRVIGWGTQDGIDYWLCVNSWNQQWGSSGTFKIERGNNQCNSEQNGFAGVRFECPTGKVLNDRAKCVVPVPTCDDSPCPSGHSCEDKSTGRVCTEIDNCANNPCSNYEQCTSSIGSHSCTLLSGRCHTASDCSPNSNCDLNTCACESGFTGNATLCTEVVATGWQFLTGQTASMSSRKSFSTNEASVAIDGITDNCESKFTHTLNKKQQGSQPWWQSTLPGSAVSKIKVWNRPVAMGRLTGCEVYLVFGAEEKLCATLPYVGVATVVELAAECSESAADIIKILQTGDPTLSICEVEIFVV